MNEHPMAQPWLNWKVIKRFPQDGEAYLATTDEIAGRHPQVVFWLEDGRLHVRDCDISYNTGFFTHWAEIPTPAADGEVG